MPLASRPLILISPRWEQKDRTVDVPELLAPEQAMATVFSSAIEAAGGLPLMMHLTSDDDVLAAYVDMADGVAIPGGQDVDPRLWGDESGYDPALLCPERDAFESALIRHVLRARKPLFTTCRGTQLLNVVLGGSLCMDVPSLGAREGMVQWRHTMILHDVAHPVEVEEGSLLSRALGGVREVQTNSSHHCCVDRLGEGVRIVARATDGVPEAIEVPSQPFCLGVQWHPEYTWNRLATDFALWRAFVAAAAGTGA